MKDDREDEDRMEVVEGNHREEFGGWTEVEMNAPREFEPKVLYVVLLRGFHALC